MNISGPISRVVQAIRDVDTRWQRSRLPHARHVLFNARTAMEYGVMSPVDRRLRADPRVATWLMSSERPDRVKEIFRDAPDDARVISPREAMIRRFDAYVAADFAWATLPRGTRRVQMFHGVAGKWSSVYERPERPMGAWHRFFFINRRRMQSYITCGAIESGSSAIRLIGMPKADCLVDGSLTRDGVLAAHGMDPARMTVMYAPTWTRFSSLNVMGEAVVAGLVRAGYRVLVKLHENSLDPAVVNSGGVDWVGRLTPILAKGDGHLLRSSDATRWLVAADVLITDHSSIGFEYLLLDRPLVRISVPELISGADIAREYVDLVATASTSVEHVSGVLAAVAQALSDPLERSESRRRLAAELFHDPGHATVRAAAALYELMELEEPRPEPVGSAQPSIQHFERALAR
jgi:hypothetical protein